MAYPSLWQSTQASCPLPHSHFWSRVIQAVRVSLDPFLSVVATWSFSVVNPE
ncbi:uncharacterized protein CTRU02_201844 [Colletotrichum truncatum]|uniref:Uncharacterized protein n=1 Tax=Colletotrichum truncatum TaxID=5467 RepID=A0ACC3ZJ61_COLTU|nr:uncharacterized protein CTRU02_06957 [Colletotrichum truncatum]KAF6791773.1 hypothetical protein CTRU02_06957 [Colletotrichum truncatum]